MNAPNDGRVERLRFWVPGKPAPQGSKRHVGGGRMIESSRNVAPWRERVALAAGATMYANGYEAVLLRGQIAVELAFVMPRPSALPRSRPTPAAVKRPDIDKLSRACLDALSGVVWADDSQVTTMLASKRIAEPDEQPGVAIEVVAWDEKAPKRPLNQTLGNETSPDGSLQGPGGPWSIQAVVG